jgi:PAS domain S-box-containing protein
MLERPLDLIRDIDDRIVSWSQGVETLYGWTAEEALGRVSHDIFMTEFPEPLDEVKDQIQREGLWSG